MWRKSWELVKVQKAQRCNAEAFTEAQTRRIEISLYHLTRFWRTGFNPRDVRRVQERLFFTHRFACEESVSQWRRFVNANTPNMLTDRRQHHPGQGFSCCRVGSEPSLWKTHCTVVISAPNQLHGLIMKKQHKCRNGPTIRCFCSNSSGSAELLRTTPHSCCSPQAAAFQHGHQKDGYITWKACQSKRGHDV